MASSEAVWRKGEILREIKKNARFDFLENEHTLETRRKKRPRDYSRDNISPLTLTKKRKLTVDKSIIIIEFKGQDNKRGAIKVQVVDILRASKLSYAGGKRKELNNA
jgi:hypothetical protein